MSNDFEGVIGYLFDPADNTALQAHLDPVGMGAGFCQNIGNNAVGEETRALILLPDNLDLHSHLNISSIVSIHYNCLFHFQIKRYLCWHRHRLPQRMYNTPRRLLLAAAVASLI